MSVSGEMCARKKSFIRILPNRLKLGSSHNCQPTSYRSFSRVLMQVKECSDMISATNTLTESKQSLAPGDRVRMSAGGRARHPKYGDRQGLLVGRGSSPSSWRIKFDERRCIQTIHQDYLEKVGRSGAGQSDSKQLHNTWEALRSNSASLGRVR